MFGDYFHYAEACHQKKRMNTDCEHCQNMCSQWHFTSRNAQILHVLQLLQHYLHIKVGKWRNQRHCLKSPALNSSFCSPLQKSKRQMEKTACRHTNIVLVLTAATCCQTLSLMHFQPSDMCDTMPALQSCSSSYCSIPGAFKVMGFCFIFVTTHADRSTRNVSGLSDQFWGFLFSSLLLPML